MLREGAGVNHCQCHQHRGFCRFCIHDRDKPGEFWAVIHRWHDDRIAFRACCDAGSTAKIPHLGHALADFPGSIAEPFICYIKPKSRAQRSICFGRYSIWPMMMKYSGG